MIRVEMVEFVNKLRDILPYVLHVLALLEVETNDAR